MKDLFASLYNKVLSFFHQAENKDKESAKDVACNRLKLVLMQDRTNLSPAIMERMRNELIDLLSKYLELDRELLDLNLAQEDDQMALMLSIPVIRAKDEKEIEELLKAEDEKNEVDNEESDEESENLSEENEESEEDDDENPEDNDNSEDDVEVEDNNVEITNETSNESKED